MAETTITEGDVTIFYFVDNEQGVTLAKAVDKDGLVLGAAMETGVAPDIVLTDIKSQISDKISSGLFNPTQVSNMTSALTHLTDKGSKNFKGVEAAAKEAGAAAAKTQSYLNDQLKAIHARLDRVDDDLIAHYAGISQLVLGLSVNPFTAASAALSLPTYNFSSAGQKLIKQLMHLIPGYDTFKQLQHLDAAGLVEGLESKLSGQMSGIKDSLKSQLATAVTEHADAVLNQASAIANQPILESAASSAAADLQAAISGGANSSVISTLTTAKFNADVAVGQGNQLLSTLTDKISKVGNITSSAKSITGFVGSITNITKGVTKSAIFKSE